MTRYRIFRSAPSGGRNPGPLQAKIVDLDYAPTMGEEVPAGTPLQGDWADYVTASPEPAPASPEPPSGKEK